MSLTILGAGLTGLSISYHAEEECEIFEKNSYAGGHIHSTTKDGFTWDEGPHVSFTNNKYVKELFEHNVNGEYLEYPVKTTNYFHGSWIPHPAQSNLFAVPQPLRDECLNDFLISMREYSESYVPNNYADWLHSSLGKTFSKTFSSAYTRKYWTTNPENLATNWVGQRIFSPDINQIKQGYRGPLPEETHYIKKIRYPKNGGYLSFAQKMMREAKIKMNHDLEYIDFNKKTLRFSNGVSTHYEKLASTIPLPLLILKSNAPRAIKDAAEQLSCTSVLLINVIANHPTQRFENWIYVYDEDKYSTRINCTELLSPNNAPKGKTGIQVEVYYSKYRPLNESHSYIAEMVCKELVEMGLVRSIKDIEAVNTNWVQWANVIFDHQRKEAQNIIFSWLEQYGLERELDDLDPMTNWEAKFAQQVKVGSIFLAGRFAQWKYYWTDDCVLRALLCKNEGKRKSSKTH
jgi:protoporphyrinogen oxidase